MLTINRAKKGYYIRRVKDSLWSIFGINRIKPFEDNYTKDQMKEWKYSKTVQKVHEDLYSQSDPDNPLSDTYLTLIIKSVFAEKELTNENAMWTLSVLESIFDVNHLSSKIDSDVIETWMGAVKREKQVYCKRCFSF